MDRYKTELFHLKHISVGDEKIINQFTINNPKGKGLENYLKRMALTEELQNNSRTYLVIDSDTGELVAYYTLRTGLLTIKAGWFPFSPFITCTGIELANFAVNDAYREAKDSVNQLGKYVFSEFIYPMCKDLQKYLGAMYLYIFALPEEKLVHHYNKMGFLRLERKYEKFLHWHVKPMYDRGCVFMCQKL